jgi:MarR family transcriptional regulator, organic hydroperoxide resistance regulator
MKRPDIADGRSLTRRTASTLRNKKFLIENFLTDSFRWELPGGRLLAQSPRAHSGSSFWEITMTAANGGAPGPRPTLDSELTWLLHRAAQRMHNATSEQAEKHGLTLREYIVLSALDKYPGLTQGELGTTLSLDKTTLMNQLDRLERRGLMVRRHAPGDRRLRIPEITESGELLRAEVAEAGAAVEASVLDGFGQDEIASLHRMLFTIIGDSEDPGSCL